MDLFCEGLCLQLIRKLPEFVEIDPRPEPKDEKSPSELNGLASR
jgi:hypothetical protein